MVNGLAQSLARITSYNVCYTKLLRFPADTALPDPFDGWLAADSERIADVHACMGCSLYVERQLVGVLTLDALQPGAFDEVDDMTVAAFGALAAATLRNVALIRALEATSEQQRALARELVQEARRREGELIGRSPPSRYAWSASSAG